MDLTTSTPTAPVAASAPIATPAATPSSAPSATAPASATNPVQDGNRGAGALSHEQSVDAMLAAFQAKNPDHPKVEDTKVAVEAPAAAETPAAETPAADAAVPPAEGDAAGEDGYSFDEDSFVGARDLAQKIDANEALKAALPQDLRNEIMANARIAEQLAPYRELFGSPEEAKIVSETAQEMARVTEAFSSIQGENVDKGASALVNLMLEMSALRDENGQPRKDAQGRLITDGTTGRFLNTMFDRRLSSIEKKIKDSGNDDAIAAFDLVMETAGLRPSTAAKTDANPEIAERQRQLDAQQAEINRQKQAGEAEKRTQYETALNGELQTLATGEFEALLKPASGLDGLTRTAVLAQLTKAMKEAVRKNTAYQMAKDRLALQPMTEARRREEVALAKRFFRDNLVRIARPILAEAGVSVSSKQATRAEAQAARAANARSEVTGAAQQPVKPAAINAKDPAEARKPFIEKLKAENGGREPSDNEITQAMMLAAFQSRKGA